MMLIDGKIAIQGTPREIQDSGDPAVYQFIAGSPVGPIAID
jgi:ABC-type transporter Mla maintaining outer membrane lipid asymmetry ATPase subunit MlaF